MEPYKVYHATCTPTFSARRTKQNRFEFFRIVVSRSSKAGWQISVGQHTVVKFLDLLRIMHTFLPRTGSNERNFRLVQFRWHYESKN